MNTAYLQLMDGLKEMKAIYRESRQKINFKILPTLSIEIDQKNETKKDLEKEYYFFAPLADHLGFPKIKEQYSEKTNEWEIVEPQKTLH